MWTSFIIQCLDWQAERAGSELCTNSVSLAKMPRLFTRMSTEGKRALTACAPASGPQIRCDSVGRAAVSRRFVYALLCAAIYDAGRSFLRQRRHDSKTNAGGRSSHKSRFTVELKIHNKIYREMRNP